MDTRIATSISISIPVSLLAALASCGGGQKSAPPVAAVPPAASTAPVAAGEPVFPEEAFRQAQPTVGSPRDFQLPEMKRFQLGERDKIDVYLVERHDLPTISMDLNVDGGSMVDPPGKVGLASVCMDLLSEGTRKLDKIAFSEALADVASDVSSYAGDDRQGVEMNTLTRSFDPTLALFVDTVTEPGLRQEDLDRIIKRRLEALKQVRGSAQSVSGRLRGMVIYGLKHPLGRVTTEKTLGAIRLADCKRYQQRYLRPRGARLFIVGDTTEAQVRQSMAPLLARWHGAPARVARPPALHPPRGRIFFVNIPGAAQSSVAMVHPGPERLAPDYFPTMLLAQVLGGGFASRINMNLREDKGYSYGAGAGFGYSRFFGTFSARSAVRTDATYQTVLEMRREVGALKDGSEPPTPDELARDKEGTILAQPAAFATAGSALDQYRALIYFGLPLDYYNGYIDAVRAVTAEQVQQAGAAHLQPEAARYLVVGDGDAAQIAHTPGEKGQKGQDRPLVDASGKPITLRAALARLVADKTLGDGGLVELDPDGAVVKPAR
ncbi:MAG TPA: pitrilysin family protein [Kofleriaceae bacterium]|nr:pitrilysin family protein [Kofleriaceae bacterium]